MIIESLQMIRKSGMGIRNIGRFIMIMIVLLNLYIVITIHLLNTLFHISHLKSKHKNV